jgi:hypothetical protein
MLRRLTAARATKNRSRATPFVRFFSATFFCARKNASHFSLSGAKKRHIQPERYVQYGLKFYAKLFKHLTKLKKSLYNAFILFLEE